MTLHPRLGAKPPRIPDRLVPLLEAAAPHFSAAEMKRRRIAFEQALSEAGASHALVVGTDRRMSALQWLTELPSSNLNMGVLSPGEPDLLFVPYPNHVAQAQMLAPDATVVWDAKGPAALAVETLCGRGTKGQTIAILGQCNYALVQQLANSGFKLVDLNRAYNAMRLIKSDEEFDWARIGCALSATVRPAAAGINAAVAVSNATSWPRSASHASMARRWGVASRRCDLATMPTRVMTPSYIDPSPG